MEFVDLGKNHLSDLLDPHIWAGSTP